MIVFEKYLGVSGGHEHTQMNAIHSLTPEREKIYVTGTDFSPLASDQCRIANILSTRKDHKHRPEWSVKHDADAIRRLVSERYGDRWPPIVVPTVGAHDFLVFLNVVAQAPDHFKVSFRVLEERHILDLSNDERRQVSVLVENGKFVLVTETSNLSEHLSRCYGLKSDDCLMLPGIMSLDSDQESLEPGRSARHLRVGCLGGFRKEKGGFILPNIIHQLSNALNGHPLEKRVEFLMQQPPVKMRKRYIRYHSKFLRLRTTTFISGALSIRTLPLAMDAAAFRMAMAEVDVLLLPYDGLAYSNRGSGIVIDGVCARKPFVHTATMKMSDLLDHGNAEPCDGSITDYVGKTLKVLSHLDQYDDPTREAAKSLRHHFQRSRDFLLSL